MNFLCLILFLVNSNSYDRNAAINYALEYAENPNHKCGDYLECTPCSYWGSEACGYPGGGGDSANFVSQCLVLGGGHPKLNGGDPCRGYPCGFEEIGCKKLGDCLIKKGWKSTCDYLLSPPSYIKAGDVLIYYSGSCDSHDAFSVFITQGGDIPKITCHSNIKKNVEYEYMKNSRPYYQWLHFEDLDNTISTTNEIISSKCPSGSVLFTLNNSCIKSCPHNFEITNENECIFKSFESDTTIDEFKNQISNNISFYINSSKVIICSNFLAIISTSEQMNFEWQLKNGISAIDLGKCTDNLKDYYRIPKEENLIVVNIESKSEISQEEISDEDNKFFVLGKVTQLEIYTYDGRKLNISICKEDIKIMKYIDDFKEIDFDSAKSFSILGIDVFNPADKFFNDICHPYNNPDNKDIILIDRRNDFYQNVTFCQNGCKYNGLNYSLNFSNCLCDPICLQEKEGGVEEPKIEFKSFKFKLLTKSFIENLLNFNYEIIKCYKLVLNLKNLFHNLGFYSLSLMFVLQIIFLFVYLIKRLKSLKLFMIKFRSKEKYNKNLNIFNIRNKGKINNNNFLYGKNDKNKAKSTPPPKNKNSTILNDLNKKKSNKTKIYFKYNFQNNINYKLNNNYINMKRKEQSHEAKNQNKMILKGSFNRLNKEGKSKINNFNQKDSLIKLKSNQNALLKLSKTNYELQDFDYEEAIIYDKRSYLKMYWGFLVETQVIFGTFCTNNNLDLFVIKLSFFVFTFQISFFLNALFYGDKYISEAYHNNGILNFFSGLPKSIYSFVATLITTDLLRMLSNSKSELMKIIKEKRYYKNYLYLINNKLDKLSSKLIIYFILVYIFGAFFLYYVTIFCIVYKNSQKYWFLGCLESFGMDSLVAIIICIFLALFRYISIKNRVKCFYTLANIISSFL